MIKKDLKIVIIPFCYRQFDINNKKCTYIESTIQEFQSHINDFYSPEKLKDGYASFCKHIFIKNFTKTKLDYAEITENNKKLLMTDYEARTEKELPILVRYFPKNVIEPKIADYLDVILYHRSQIEIENKAMGEEDVHANLDYEWGVVSVKPSDVDYELPMDPITIMRNALGVEHGGSGVPLDKKKYLESVNFWSKNGKIK